MGILNLIISVHENMKGNVWGHHLALKQLDDRVHSLYCEKCNYPTFQWQLPSYGQKFLLTNICPLWQRVCTWVYKAFISPLKMFIALNSFWITFLYQIILISNVETAPWRLSNFNLFNFHSTRIASSACSNNGWHLQTWDQGLRNQFMSYTCR